MNLGKALLFCTFTFSIHSAFAGELETLALKLQHAREVATDLNEFRNLPVGLHAVEEEFENYVNVHGVTQTCEDLNDLAFEQLIELSDVLDHLAPSKLSCLNAIQQKIDLYYQAQQALMPPLQPEPEVSPFSAPQSWTSEHPIDDRSGGLSLPPDLPLPRGLVALTFDDGPHSTRTDAILRVLAEEGVLANFFVLGRMASQYPSVLQRIAQYGHAVGTHSYSHPDLSRMSYSNAVSQIERGFQHTSDALGFTDPFFRFPYGARTHSLRNYLRQQRISDFFWDVDTLDWKYKDPDYLLQYALRQTTRKGRGIVLFHDIQAQTVAMLPAYIRELKRQGYRFVVYRAGNRHSAPR